MSNMAMIAELMFASMRDGFGTTAMWIVYGDAASWSMLHIPSEFSSSLASNTDEMPIISGSVVVIASSIILGDETQSITNTVRGINDAILKTWVICIDQNP